MSESFCRFEIKYDGEPSAYISVDHDTDDILAEMGHVMACYEHLLMRGNARFVMTMDVRMKLETQSYRDKQVLLPAGADKDALIAKFRGIPIELEESI